MASGYSGKPLAAKLGMKPGYRVLLVNAPSDYMALLGPAADGVLFVQASAGHVDLVHLFTLSLAELDAVFARLKRLIVPTGALWVSWPKGKSGVATDLNENIVRDIGLAQGLVDVKVIAVDEVWSGLKFVYRLSDRPSGKPQA